VNCQACGVSNPPGAAACIACGVLLTATAGPSGPRCRKHAETPATGTCSRCGSFGCGVCLTQKGATWLCDDCAARAAVLPWDERETLGTWRAWWRTSVKMMSSPVQTLESAAPEGSLGSSALFALLSTLVGYLPTFVLLFGAAGLGFAFASRQAAKPASAEAVPFVAILAGELVMILVLQVAAVFFWAALDHLMLKLLGAQPRRFEVTVRANALSMGPMLLGLVPVCGAYVFPVWALVLRILGLMHLHRTTAGKAVLAVLLPIAVLICLAAVAYVGLIALVGSQAFR
jgi:hypothetical protein